METLLFRSSVGVAWDPPLGLFVCLESHYSVGQSLEVRFTFRQSPRTTLFLPLPASGSFLAKDSFHADPCLSWLLWLPLTSSFVLSGILRWYWLPWRSPDFRIISWIESSAAFFPLWGGTFAGPWNEQHHCLGGCQFQRQSLGFTVKGTPPVAVLEWSPQPHPGRQVLPHWLCWPPVLESVSLYPYLG